MGKTGGKLPSVKNSSEEGRMTTGKWFTKAEIKKLEKKGNGKIPVSDFIGAWLDPKNGKIGETFQRNGVSQKTKSFHSVTSGFNEAIRAYYGKDPVAILQQAEEKELVSLRPVGRGKSGKGVPGVRVSAYRDYQDTKGVSILADMGLS